MENNSNSTGEKPGRHPINYAIKVTSSPVMGQTAVVCLHVSCASMCHAPLCCFSDTSTKSVKPESNGEEMSDQPKQRILSNNQPTPLKNVNAINHKDPRTAPD